MVRRSVVPSVCRSVGPSARVEKWENERFRSSLLMCPCWEGGWVWMGVGCPCPPVRNEIVTQRLLLTIQARVRVARIRGQQPPLDQRLSSPSPDISFRMNTLNIHLVFYISFLPFCSINNARYLRVKATERRRQ